MAKLSKKQKQRLHLMKTPKKEKRAVFEEGWEPEIVKIGANPADFGKEIPKDQKKSVKSGENLL